MSGECHYCHGLVSASERDHIVLDQHGNHEVYLHEQCADGHNLIGSSAASGEVEIVCPECGTVETH
ncbi:hypothetical protein NDI85_17340 [Halomicroarcula sp. S1AR25-4]|uniref:hypothetical protein n=1 Tax=Haloarcula sp. S1AR25-4 TaxID=2950538 RepID=UPI002876C1BA|nr:hypothetical protein [Halomicroarcula sp. S1AR25-4]MDS0279561.1 hypothetical protein [Halomicroarcula sp. S1AR25-4]